MNGLHAAAKKRFGQHFLVDQRVIERIIMALAPAPGDRLVEIGPGLGALTLPLLRRHGSLCAIEFDRDLIAPLRDAAQSLGIPARISHHPSAADADAFAVTGCTPSSRLDVVSATPAPSSGPCAPPQRRLDALATKCGEKCGLDIITADVLRVDFSALAAGGMIRLVGNLPYNISSPILFHALDHAAAIHDMHFMLQKEVVERMAAAPGSKVYGRLSVMLQALCEVVPLFEIGPQAFRPPPKVDSAVVRLQPKPAAQIGIADRVLFARVVHDAFGQRRKTLRNALANVCDAAALLRAGIRPELRAEQLPVASFIALSNTLHREAAITPSR